MQITDWNALTSAGVRVGVYIAMVIFLWQAHRLLKPVDPAAALPAVLLCAGFAMFAIGASAGGLVASGLQPVDWWAFQLVQLTQTVGAILVSSGTLMGLMRVVNLVTGKEWRPWRLRSR